MAHRWYLDRTTEPKRYIERAGALPALLVDERSGSAFWPANAAITERPFQFLLLQGVETAVWLLAAVPFAIAATALLGWALRIEALKCVGLGYVTMNPATALAFLIVSVALLARSRKGKIWTALATALIVGVGCIGVTKLSDLLWGSHFNVDTILFASRLSSGYAQPSRIAPNTAGCFVLDSIALLLMRRRSDRAIVAAQVVACTASLIAAFTVIGHLYGVAAFYVVAALHPMALNAAIAFLSLSGFVLLETADRGIVRRISDQGPAGRTSRALIPAAVVIPALLGWLRQQGEHAGLFDQEIGIAIMVTLTMLFMTALIWLNAGWLLASDKLRRLAEAEVKHMARHDSLTGLPNRSHFMEQLMTRVVSCTRHSNASFAILIMDLDGFKQVNDQLGHVAGDNLLRQVALFLKSCMHPNTTLVARLGGDEFVMLLDQIAGEEEAASIARRVVTSMPRHFGPEGEMVAISISVGVVVAGQRRQLPDDLLNQADQALYHSKRTGKGRFSIYRAAEIDAFGDAL